MIGDMYYEDAKTPPPLIDRIKKAAESYKKKYGRDPKIVLINRDLYYSTPDSDLEEIKALPYRVAGVRYVLPKVLWVGIEEKLVIEDREVSE